jgi:SAM-dependent methyltransferase
LSELEFTGERVVPGLVDPNLFNEHLARYRFAALFAENGRVLDAGCGSGYGAAEFAGTASSVIAMDISAEAVTHARNSFAGPRTSFLQGRCERLPFADGSFDLIAAFEVIEHLAGWRDFLSEARRVLCPSGVLLVSTPNKDFYSESRADAGPNPFHVHEFQYREFEAALAEVFPHVHLWSQNHSEVISLVSADSTAGILDSAPDTSPEHAHFFLAAGSRSPIPLRAAFAWMPSSGNVLRERQHHIALLEGEIAAKNKWLKDAEEAQAGLQREYDTLSAELRERNVWGERLNREIEEARALIEEQRDEMQTTRAAYERHLGRLEAESAERLVWARGMEVESAARLEWARNLEAQLTERTGWAQSLVADVDRERAFFQALQEEHQQTSRHLAQTLEQLLQAQAEVERLEAARAAAEAAQAATEATKWVRLGRGLHLMRDKSGDPAAAHERSDK